MKDKILAELNWDTISFNDADGHWFEGIEKKDFNDLADRIYQKIVLHLSNEKNS